MNPYILVAVLALQTSSGPVVVSSVTIKATAKVLPSAAPVKANKAIKK